MIDPSEVGDPSRFDRLPPGMREWLEFNDDYGGWPDVGLPFICAIMSSLTEPSGKVDMRRIDKKALERLTIGRSSFNALLREARRNGFMRCEEGKRPRLTWFVRGDIAREVLDARAGVRREGLRVVPGGKGDA